MGTPFYLCVVLYTCPWVQTEMWANQLGKGRATKASNRSRTNYGLKETTQVFVFLPTADCSSNPCISALPLPTPYPMLIPSKLYPNQSIATCTLYSIPGSPGHNMSPCMTVKAYKHKLRPELEHQHGLKMTLDYQHLHNTLF